MGWLIGVLLLLHLINPFDMAHIFAYLLIPIIALTKKQYLIELLDFDFLLLLLFGFTYSAFNVFGEHKGVQYLFMQALFPAFFYLLGKFLLIKHPSQSDLRNILFLLALAFTITSLVSVLLDLVKGGFAQTGRLIENFWTGKKIKSTGMAGYLTYVLTIPALIIGSNEKAQKLKQVILIGLYLISLICVFRLGSRTGIVITFLSFGIGIVIHMYLKSAKKNLQLFFRLVLALSIFILFVPINLESKYFSTLGHRLQSKGTSSNESAGGRTELWKNAIENFQKHPLGWQAKKHSHNLWLDVAKVGGIIPFMLLLIFNFRNLKNIKKLLALKKDNTYLEIKLIFALFTLAPFIQFSVEPIVEGSLYKLTFFIMIQGMLKKHLEMEWNRNKVDVASPIPTK